MKGYELRDGKQEDFDWLYELYCKTMMPSIQATWGWDEQFQRNGFINNLNPANWKIVSSSIDDVGGFVLEENSDHLWLRMIIIKPEHQGKGIGQCVMKYLKEIAGEKSLPLRLRVIKANPVRPFYLNLGFKQLDEDDAFYNMEWRP